MNKFFLDSSIIIEYLKINGLNEAKKIMDFIYSNFLSLDIYINLIIIDETVFFYLKNKNKISFSLGELKLYLDSFNFLLITTEIKDKMFNLIQNYQLKPHDSLILATCQYYKIFNLISLDSDFIPASSSENINLIQNLDELKNSI